MDIRVSPDPALAAARWIGVRLRGAVRRRGSASLALSGGSTAPPMIAVLTAMDLPWEQIGVWQVDERIAPNGHPDRNLGQLADLPCAVYAMPVDASAHDIAVTDRPPVAAALATAAGRYGDGLPDRFDVVHLGIGSDGHTASWPPGDDRVVASPKPVEVTAVFNGYRRMTLTRRVVNGARARAVLARGDAKREVVERWLLGDRSLPVASVRGSRTWVFLDEAAAPHVPLHPRQSG